MGSRLFAALVAVGGMVVSASAEAGNGEWTPISGISYGDCNGPSAAGFAECVRSFNLEDHHICSTQSPRWIEPPHQHEPGVWRATFDIWREQYFADGCEGETTIEGPIEIEFSNVPGCEAGFEFDPDTGECGEGPCVGVEGEPVELDWTGDPIADVPTCMTESSTGESCAVTQSTLGVCLGGSCYTEGSYTGVGCETSEGTDDGQDTAVDCVSSGGNTMCYERGEENCGTFNGEQMCLDSIPPGDCAFLGDGGMICGDAAGAPPAPTQSDGTTPAGSDASFDASNADGSRSGSFDYFSAATVATSGSNVEGGDAGEGGDGGDGDGEGDSSGLCGEDGDCSDDLPGGGDFEDVGTVESNATTFMGRVENAPIVAAVSGLGTSMPSGECPSPDFSVSYLDGVNLSLDQHCTLWADVANIIGTVMLAVYVFMGARILMSA